MAQTESRFIEGFRPETLLAVAKQLQVDVNQLHVAHGEVLSQLEQERRALAKAREEIAEQKAYIEMIDKGFADLNDGALKLEKELETARAELAKAAGTAAAERDLPDLLVDDIHRQAGKYTACGQPLGKLFTAVPAAEAFAVTCMMCKGAAPLMASSPQQAGPGVHLEASRSGSAPAPSTEFKPGPNGFLALDLRPFDAVDRLPKSTGENSGPPQLSPVILGRLKHHHGPSATKLHPLGDCTACDQLRREERITSSEVQLARIEEQKRCVDTLRYLASDVNLPEADRSKLDLFIVAFERYTALGRPSPTPVPVRPPEAKGDAQGWTPKSVAENLVHDFLYRGGTLSAENRQLLYMLVKQTTEWLQRTSAAAVEAEREACVQVIEAYAKLWDAEADGYPKMAPLRARDIRSPIERIRARSKP